MGVERLYDLSQALYVISEDNRAKEFLEMELPS